MKIRQSTLIQLSARVTFHSLVFAVHEAAYDLPVGELRLKDAEELEAAATAIRAKLAEQATNDGGDR